jgi:hypothetical protein
VEGHDRAAIQLGRGGFATVGGRARSSAFSAAEREDFLERAKVDRRLDVDVEQETGVVPLDGADRAHRDALRVDAAEPGGDDPVAELDVGQVGDVPELQGVERSRRPFGDPRHPAALDPHRDRAIGMDEEQRLRAIGPHLDHLPGQSILAGERHSLADALVVAPIEDHGGSSQASGPLAHHLAPDQIERLAGFEPEHGAQAFVLEPDFLGAREIEPGRGQLLAEPLPLGVQLAEPLEPAVSGAKRAEGEVFDVARHPRLVGVGEQHQDKSQADQRPHRHLFGAAVEEMASTSKLGSSLHSALGLRGIRPAGNWPPG